MKIAARIALVIVALVTLSACDGWKFWESNPTAPDLGKVPFGEPEALWDTGIGEVLVYTTDGRVWLPSTEEEFDRALGDLLFRIERVVGPQETGQLTLAQMNLVLQDSRSDGRYDSGERAFWVSGADEFQRVALEYFCERTRSRGICDLKLSG